MGWRATALGVVALCLFTACADAGGEGVQPLADAGANGGSADSGAISRPDVYLLPASAVWVSQGHHFSRPDVIWLAPPSSSDTWVSPSKDVDELPDADVEEDVGSLPADTWIPPEDTWTPPEDTWTSPEDTWTPPEDTWTLPEDTWTPPEDTWTPPEDTWTPPEDTWTPPEDTWTPPEDTWTPPEDAWTPPEDVWTPPEDTWMPPEDIWTAPEDVLTPPEDTGEAPPEPVFPVVDDPRWPEPNVYSWDGSWAPSPADFPLDGLLDDEYFDGHTTWDGTVSPILPPGQWDWNDAQDDLANWRSFAGAVGVFEQLRDGRGNLFGWLLVGNDPQAVQFNGPAHYFEATPGTDVLRLGPLGVINSDVEGDLLDGPDVLIFDRGWSLDFRTGSTMGGSLHDNDLVVAGCTPNEGDTYDIRGMTIHTGPGSDWVFARDMKAAAIDLGNGDGGITSALDTTDGDDLVVLRGNIADVRVFGGDGDDTVVWYLDEIQDDGIAFLGPNLFGAGGSGAALWDEGGTDRLVLVIPPDTRIVDRTPTEPGDLMVRVWHEDDGTIWWDEPVYDDLYARYCITCGVGPSGQRTMNLEYRSADGSVFTGWFWVNNFQELQLGLGADAALYRFDEQQGRLDAAPDLSPYVPPETPQAYCDATGGGGPVDPGPVVPGGPPLELLWPPEDVWPPADAPVAEGLYPNPTTGGWPQPNAYSWNGSWSLGAYPFPGMFDDEYHDGHTNWEGVLTPILPPGEWDWDDERDDLANWRNFAGSIGTFAPLLDAQRRQFGWRLLGNEPEGVDMAAASHYYEGTSGVDILNLGPGGWLHSYETGTLGAGPDVLVFDRGWSLEFWTGASLAEWGSWGRDGDDDLVIAGCGVNAPGSFDTEAISVHTGPGADWIFVRDTFGAAFDAGNGEGGRTDTLDPDDGDDLVVFDGNIRDVRAFGGGGDDVVVWYLDGNLAGDISPNGPNFFGGGGSGDAVWDTEGVDRLVLDIPPDTPFVDRTPTPAGALLFRAWAGDDGEIWWDDPVREDPFARYCIVCGRGPGGERTIQLEYRSANDQVFTGWFWMTDFEELQLGAGPDAAVFRVDQVTGTATPAPDLTPFLPPPHPEGYCE